LYLRRPTIPLERPVLDFLSELRREEFAAGETRTRTPALSLPSNSSLAHLIGRLAATRSHKIFVADAKEYRPAAVISLTDLLRALLAIRVPPRRMSFGTPFAAAALAAAAFSGGVNTSSSVPSLSSGSSSSGTSLAAEQGSLAQLGAAGRRRSLDAQLQLNVKMSS